MSKKCGLDKKIFAGIGARKITASGKGRKKPMSFDVFAMDNSLIDMLFFGAENDALNKIKKTINNVEIYSKIAKSFKKAGRKNMIAAFVKDQGLKGEDAGEAVKFMSLALAEVMAAMTSEPNVAKEVGISGHALESTIHNIDGDGSRKLNALNISQTLGEQYVQHQGVKLVAEAHIVKRAYGEAGMHWLELLEEAGLISIDKDSTIIDAGYYDENGAPYKRGKALTLDGFTTISINPDAFLTKSEKHKDRIAENRSKILKAIESMDLDTMEDFEALHDTVHATSAVKRLIIPSNEMAPFQEVDITSEEFTPVIRELGDHDGPKITTAHENLIEELQTKKQRINPRINKLMLHMSKTLKAMDDISTVSADATLKKLYASVGFDDPHVQHAIFGTFIGSTTDSFDSKMGQSISKENPFLQLLLHYEDFVNDDGSSKDFYHQLGVYRTTRLEYMSTFLDEQTDKNFARQMIEGESIVVDKSSAIGEEIYNDILYSIMDESGVDVTAIEDAGVAGYEGLDLAIELYDKNFIKGGSVENQAKFMEALAKNEIGGAQLPVGLKGGVFEQMKILGAIADIRSGKGEAFETSYRTTMDAAASGVMLSFLQNVGKDSLNDANKEDAVMAILEGMGYTLNGKDIADQDLEIQDAYYILLNAVEAASKQESSPDTDTLALMEKLSDLGIFKDTREISKPMTMVTNYQAGEKTAVESTSAELRESVIEHLLGSSTKESRTFVAGMIKKGNKALYEKYFLDEKGKQKSLTGQEIANIEGVNDAIDKYFNKNLSNFLRKYIDKGLEPMKGYKARIASLMENIEKIVNEDIADLEKDPDAKAQARIIPYMAWATMTKDERTYPGNPGSPEFAKHHDGLLKKYGMKLTSKKQAIVDFDDGGRAMILKEILNPLTALVNTIHGVDSGIFFKSHIDTREEIAQILEDGKYNGKDLTQNDIDGFTIAMESASGMIHDANNANPYYNIIYKKHYRRNSVESSVDYDIEEQLTLTYLSLQGANRQYAPVDGLENYNETQKRVERKREALKNVNPETHRFFGFPEGKPEPDQEKLEKRAKKNKAGSKPKKRNLKAKKSIPTKDLAAAEEVNGEYDPNAQTHTERDSDVIYPRTMKEGNGGNDFYTPWDELEDDVKETSKEYKELIESGESYWELDIENAWSTKDAPLDNDQILEIYAREMKNSEPTGIFIHKTSLPMYPEQYAMTTEGTDYQPYSYFADQIGNPDVDSYTSESNGGSATKQSDQNIMMFDFMDELNDMGGDINLVAYNGDNLDFRLINEVMETDIAEGGNISQQFKDKLNTFDTYGMVLGQHRKHGVINKKGKVTKSESKNIFLENRKLGTIFAEVATARQKDKFDSLKGSHSAEADVYMMNVINEDALASFEDKGGELAHDNLDDTAEPTEILSDAEVDAKVKELAKNNPLIARFIDSIKVRSKSFYSTVNDLVNITNNANIGMSELEKQIEHEIRHKQTAAYTALFPDDPDVKYITDSIEKMRDLKDIIYVGINDPAIKKRLDKILTEENDFRAMQELIAIFGAEPEVASTFASALKSKGLVPRVKRLLRKINDWFKGKDPTKINPEEIFKAVQNVIESGDVFNENTEAANKGRKVAGDKLKGGDALNYDATDELNKSLSYKRKKPNNSNTEGNAIENGWRTVNNYSSLFVRFPMEVYVEPGIVTGIKKADKMLMKNSDIYKKNRLYLTDIWKASEPLASMKTYIDRTRVGDLFALNQLETTQLKAEQEVTDFEDKTITKINDLLRKAKFGKKKLNKQDRAAITKTFAHTPLFHLINNDNNYDRLLDAEDFDQELKNMIEEYSEGLTKERIVDAKNLGKVLAKKTAPSTTTFYNVEQMKIKKKLRSKVEVLVALHALQNTDDAKKVFRIMNQNKDLSNEMALLSKALQSMAVDVLDGSKDKKNFRENLVYEQFETPKEFRAISIHNRKDYPAKKGWKILREPSNEEYGVVWRERGKVTAQSGAGLSENFKYFDIMVDEGIKNDNAKNAIEVQNDTSNPYHKVVLTTKELESFSDLITEPADVLARAYGGMLKVKQTKAAREYIIYGDKISKPTTRAQALALEKKLKKKDVAEHPWMIKVPTGANFTTIEKFMDDYPEIAALYKVPEQISRIDGFDTKFDLVRKDMHDMIMGYKDPELGEGNPLVKNLTYVIRQGVTLIKTHWVIVNPAKIAADIASNQIILTAYGVPVGSLLRKQKDSLSLAAEMSKMRSDLVMVEFDLHRHSGDKEGREYKKAVLKKKALEKKMHKHRMMPLVQNGMIQSMSTEVLRKDEAVVTGLQKDMERIFNTVLKNDKGKQTALAEAIQAFADSGFDPMGLVEFAGKGARNVEMLVGFGGEIAGALEESAGRISKKKKQKDMAKYLSEFIASPDSEAVRLGSYLVQMADVAARLTLYEHLMENNVVTDHGGISKKKLTEKEIIETVLEAFVDYKVNMPKELKFLSDYGILLFPSFWLRIQKITYALAKANPAKVAGGLLIEDMLSMNIASYMDSNIFAKFGDIINEPPIFTDPIDAILPADFLEQASFGLIDL